MAYGGDPMSNPAIPLPPAFQTVVDRFVAACAADQRVLAAFLGGSYATGAADEHSDLDLGLITTDEAYDEFMAGREGFIRLLGEPLFLEHFDNPHTLFFILAGGAECELAVGRAGAFTHIHGGPYRVLLDKQGIMAGAEFPWHTVPPEEQAENLRRLIFWFWHDLSHLIAAVGRGQLWWAQGQLEILRLSCVNLLRLRQDFVAATDSYDKVEKAVSAEQLAPLQATVGPLERDALLRAASVVVAFYRELAEPLAQAHGIPYPHRLDEVMISRLARLDDRRR